MRISKVRDYIISRVVNQDNSFREWRDGFNFENIPRNIFDKAFHIYYTVPSIDNGGDHLTSNISVTLKLFYKGFKNTQEALDEAMDKSNLIGVNVKSMSSIASFRAVDDFPIQRVTFNSMNSEALNSNDNAWIITLEFTMTVLQSVC